jgi:hypothetical protein
MFHSVILVTAGNKKSPGRYIAIVPLPQSVWKCHTSPAYHLKSIVILRHLITGLDIQGQIKTNTKESEVLWTGLQIGGCCPYKWSPESSCKRKIQARLSLGWSQIPLYWQTIHWKVSIYVQGNQPFTFTAFTKRISWHIFGAKIGWPQSIPGQTSLRENYEHIWGRN